MDELTFREAKDSDLESILQIYNHYITTTTATFDHAPISENELRRRIFIGHRTYKTYVMSRHNKMAGFCFLTRWRKKEAYSRTTEIGVYFKPEFTGTGMGMVALAFLERVARGKQMRVILASVSGENSASLKLFERMGYERCAHYKGVGEKFGRFLDIVDYQKVL